MAQPDFPEAQRIIYLVSRYIDGGIDFAELQELDNWRKAKSDNEILFAELTNKQNQDQAIRRMQSYDSQESLNKLRQKIAKEKLKDNAATQLWKLLLTAASITLLIGTFLFFYFEKQDHLNDKAALKPNPQYIPAGTNQAILTLAGGKKVILNKSANGIIATQGNIQVKNAKDGKLIYSETGQINGSTSVEYNTIETPRAGKYKVQLPDGTNVWLNAASSLHYPIAFNGKTRDVMLTGEAYFEVAKDKHKPFTVTSSGQTVTVLGTHFNINAYKDESNINTTLLEGSVRVNANDKQALLKPGEQSILSGETIKVSKANTHLATAWKDGQMAFVHTDLKSVLRQISRWYNVDVEYVGKVPDISISGDASMDADLSIMLKMLQFYNVHFVQQGRKLIITN
ncbi:FecR family protein [Mucilaginibacter pineti]|uniref:FecR family protein n=1 Tax=Mucilaginibacter pineti TaxID=1391627 RepID=A0A1G7GH50_9SPHI|nr:FecR family protein [Mucilaginibacter pineti]SDE87492.1 FecR family protein [Mucilaginibacter pineti]